MFRRSLICISVISFLVTGCWDRSEIEERLLVAAIGIDTTEKGDRISFQVPIPSQVVGGGSGGGGSTQESGGGESIEIYSENSSTLAEAIKKVGSKASQTPFFGYTQLLLIGEQKAKKGISVFLQGLRQHPEIRRRFWPIVVEGSAEDMMKTKTKLEVINSVLIRETLENGVRRGRVPDVNLKDLSIDLSNPIKRNPMMNVMDVTEDQKIQWKGIAVFKNDKMIDILSGGLADALNHIRGEQSGRNLVTSCDHKRGIISFHPKKVRREIHVSNQPSLSIDVYVTGSIQEASCHLKIKGTQSAKILQNLLEKEYDKYGKQLFNKAQKEDKTDYLLLGDYLYSYHPGVWKKIDWEKDFPHIPIKVKYHVKVEQLGIAVP